MSVRAGGNGVRGLGDRDERVLIVESPSLNDIEADHSEGEPLDQLLHLVRVGSTYERATSIDRFSKVLASRASEHTCLHICGHGQGQGGREGFHFAGDSPLTWEQMSRHLLGHGSNRIIVVAACSSDEMRLLFKSLADALRSFVQVLVPNAASPMPRCVLTVLGNVTFADSLLAWGIFYRHLFDGLARQGTTVANAPARVILDALKAVKGANLGLHICAAYWHDRFSRYANISPWKGEIGGEKVVKQIEQGELTPEMVL